MMQHQNNPWEVPEVGGTEAKDVKIPNVQAPSAPVVAQSEPGVAEAIGTQYAVSKSGDFIDDTVTPWLEETGSSIMDNGLSYGLQEGGMKAMEGITPGSSLTSGLTTGNTGLTATGAGSQSAMLAEQGFLPETLSTLQSTAAATTPATNALAGAADSGIFRNAAYNWNGAASVAPAATTAATTAGTTAATATGAAAAGGGAMASLMAAAPYAAAAYGLYRLLK